MKPAEWAARHESEPLDVVVTGLSSDAHTWNLVFIQLLLEDLGHNVVNLGPCVPVHEVLEACRARRPDLLVVSSVNGHGFNDALPLIAALRSCTELAGMRAVVGGKLGVAGERDRERAAGLVEAGFDAVFVDGRRLANGDGDSLTAFEDYVECVALETDGLDVRSLEVHGLEAVR